MPKPSVKAKATKGIDTFFNKKSDVISHVVSEKSVEEISVASTMTKDPVIEEFYKSLSPNEKIAHDLAEKMLGTSYDIMRTHGFIAWHKSKKE